MVCSAKNDATGSRTKSYLALEILQFCILVWNQISWLIFKNLKLAQYCTYRPFVCVNGLNKLCRHKFTLLVTIFALIMIINLEHSFLCCLHGAFL